MRKIKIEKNRIYNMDCLFGMKYIDDESIDMILCDLPYGTTVLACINLNRDYVGFEFDEDYYNLANKRIEEHEVMISLALSD